MTKTAISDEKFLRVALREVNQFGRTDGATFLELDAAGLAQYKGGGGLILTTKGRARLAELTK